jgi:hypothetical protein
MASIKARFDGSHLRQASSIFRPQMLTETDNSFRQTLKRFLESSGSSSGQKDVP